MRVIVTGGAGFIGSHLCRRLLKDGHSVLAVDNLSSGYIRNLPTGVVFKWLDLTDEDTALELPKEGVDVVFHLASHVGQELSFERPVFDLKANAFSTLLLLQWCLKHQVKQFVFASSMNVYGDPSMLPVTESSPVRPPSPYAVGKIASEYLCQIYQGFGVNTTSLRLFNVYGPMQDMDNLKQGMVSIYMAYVARGEPILVRGSKERFRDFVFIKDIVDAFVRCVGNERAYGKVYNVSTGRKTYVSDLLKEIIQVFGHSENYPIIQGDPTRRDQFGIYGDSSLLQEDLGWKPTVRLEEGLAEMASWVRQDWKLQNV
ncbi:MAG: NAD-dependent epimerase/dehydratase family protein [Chlamydiae bacterium]|nr:NAD-dependent epimerase/dehydratase family protein [Chlamydiota bacterium]MBI3276225.1 NAD-dependent epimerase/dehydratase family protein [Chlamydiota bacterium]